MYNAAPYIEESLTSILEQTYKNIEVLVIDDKSTDKSVDIVTSIAKKDKRVVLLKNAKNLGIGGNRDKGIQHAKGEYICWQDADDISLPRRIELQVGFLEAHPRVGVVGGYITFFDENGPASTRTYAMDDSKLRASIFRFNPVAQPASMMRAECFAQVGGFNSKYRLSEDLEMLFRIGTEYEFGNVQEVVLMYRQSGGSLTAANLKEMEKATLKIRDSYKHHEAYNYTLGDGIYNALQGASMAMPTGLRMRIFKFIRGDK